MTGERRTWAAIFLVSLAALSYEVLLLRIFSIALWHHFASMVVSIAMLGVAVSGTLIAVLDARFRVRPRLRPWYFLIFGLTIPLSYLAAAAIPFDPVKLAWDGSQLLWISCYYLTLAASFCIAGLIVASAFTSLGERAGTIYAADLAGAAAGAVLILLLQNLLSPGRAVVGVAILPFLAALLCGGRAVRTFSLAGIALLLASLLAVPDLLEPKMSSYKEMPTLLRMHGAGHLSSLPSPYGRADLFRSPGSRYAPGLSLRFRGVLPEQLGLAIDGGAVTSVTLPARDETLAFLDYLPQSLAYRLRPGGEVFLIDPRGGLPRLMAGHHGAAVTGCAESNPAVTAILRRQSGIASLPCGKTGLARNILAGTGRTYDIIDLSLTGSLPAAMSGAGAEYQLTVEAMAVYLRSLGEEGILNVSLYVTPPYRSELRVFTTLLEALEKVGASEPRRHVAALRSLGVLTLLVCRRPFSGGELAAIGEFADDLWFDPVWHGGLKTAETERHIRSREGGLAAAYLSLTDPVTGEGFVRDYLFDISPTSDERPFFHDHLRISTLGDVFRLVDGKWDFFITEGGLLPAVLIQVLILGLVLIVAPAFAAGTAAGDRRYPTLAYFSCLGIAYMLVEIALIERLILPLEHPPIAFAVVVSALLVGSGLGSWQTRALAPSRLWQAALAAACFALLLSFASGSLAARLSALAPAVRWGAIWVCLFPLGWIMGVPFPGGVRHLAARRRDLIPWAWAVNGFFSVLSPLLAALVARHAGFGTVFLLAAAAYGGAAWAGLSFCASPTMGTKRTPPS